MLKRIQLDLAYELRIILISEKTEFCKVTSVSHQAYCKQDINGSGAFVRAVQVRTGCSIWSLHSWERMLVEGAKRSEINLIQTSLKKVLYNKRHHSWKADSKQLSFLLIRCYCCKSGCFKNPELGIQFRGRCMWQECSFVVISYLREGNLGSGRPAQGSWSSLWSCSILFFSCKYTNNSFSRCYYGNMQSEWDDSKKKQTSVACLCRITKPGVPSPGTPVLACVVGKRDSSSAHLLWRSTLQLDPVVALRL